MESLVPALFLDRDGIIHREVGYLSRPEQVQFLPGIFDLCRAAKATGHKIIIVTNQSGIARGLYSEADFHLLMDWIAGRFSSEQITMDGYYFCPHHPDHGTGIYRKDCPDRKPNPGMILHAAQEHGIDLPRSVLVGDRCSDIQAGTAAGIGKLFLLEGTESRPCPSSGNHAVVSALSDVTSFFFHNNTFH